MSSGRQSVLAIGIFLLPPSALLPTEPCPSSPCQEPSGALTRSRCNEAAEWIAVGDISEVVHHKQGPPLSKDFAEFTFTVKRWEKGTGKTGRKLRFHVGWCDNQQELPKDTSSPFRVFGAPPGPNGEPRYLFLEELTGKNNRPR